MKVNSSKGFTLIEVMISVVIMAVLSLLTYQAIRTASQNRGKVQELLRNEAKLGDALRVLEHDVSRAFHYRNIHFEVLSASRKELQRANQQPGGNNQGSDGQQNQVTPSEALSASLQAPLRPPPNYSGFVGDEASLYLTTLSNYRTLSDVPQSDQLTVGYWLDECPRREGSNPVGKCLLRSQKYFLERDIEKVGDVDVVVENVQMLKFRYFGLGQDDWVDRWSSIETGEDFSRNKFPLAVEISLSLYTADEPAPGQTAPPTLQRTIIVPIRFPNNPEGSEPVSSGVRDVPL